MLLLLLKNAVPHGCAPRCHCEKIKEKNGEFATTKKDKNLLHGIGIKNVRKVVSDLNGQIDISYTDDTFHVGILLPNYE